MITEKIDKYEVRVPKQKQPIVTPKDEINLHAIVCTVGKRNSGKSYSVFSKLRDLKEQGLAHRIYLISPTKLSNMHLTQGLIDEDDMYEEMTNASVEAILEKVEQDVREYEDYLSDVELYKLWKKLERKNVAIDDIDPELLIKLDERGIIDMEHPPVWKYGKPVNGVGVFHMVCDDCQSSPLFVPSTRNKFLNFIIRHRHTSSRPNLKVGISVWMMLQNYSCQAGGVPKAIRENCTQLCIFKIQQRDMVEKIASECGEIDKDKFMQAYDHATAEPHNFLMIDFNPKDKNKIFRRNWNEYLLF